MARTCHSQQDILSYRLALLHYLCSFGLLNRTVQHVAFRTGSLHSARPSRSSQVLETLCYWAGSSTHAGTP